METYVSRKQRIQGKGATFSVIIGEENNADVLYGHDQCEGPDDDGQRAQEVIIGWIGREGRRVDIERAGANVTVDDSGRLICQPEGVGTSLTEHRGPLGTYQARIQPLYS